MVLVYASALTVFFLMFAHLLYLFDGRVDKENLFRRKKKEN
jgi:hypothetical protein